MGVWTPNPPLSTPLRLDLPPDLWSDIEEMTDVNRPNDDDDDDEEEEEAGESPGLWRFTPTSTTTTTSQLNHQQHRHSSENWVGEVRTLSTRSGGLC